MGTSKALGVVALLIATTSILVVQTAAATPETLLCTSYGEVLRMRSTSFSGTMADKDTRLEVSPIVNCSFVVSAPGIYLHSISIDCEPGEFAKSGWNPLNSLNPLNSRRYRILVSCEQIPY